MRLSLILPTFVIVVSAGAGIVYLLCGNIKMGVYWIGTAVINAASTYW
jgi:hypothetical protein